MRFGLSLPIHGSFADPTALVELAVVAENAGWDGFFIWDHIAWQDFGKHRPVTDPWIVLAAIAARTTGIRFGPMVTPLARRRPWKVARECVALDHLSDGRLILGVGLGATAKTEFQAFGEEGNSKIRGHKLNEALDVLTGLWRGAPYTHSGKHYQVEKAHFIPPPRQSPRIPIWVGGSWRDNQKRRPFRRAARFDGVFPLIAKHEVTVDEKGKSQTLIRRDASPDDMREIRAYIMQHRSIASQDNAAPFDIVCGRPLSEAGIGDAMIIEPYADAGVTWWVASAAFSQPLDDELHALIRQGPPRL